MCIDVFIYTEELKSRSRYADAAMVLEQYAGDTEEAISTLIHGALWDEAIRLVGELFDMNFEVFNDNRQIKSHICYKVFYLICSENSKGSVVNQLLKLTFKKDFKTNQF